MSWWRACDTTRVPGARAVRRSAGPVGSAMRDSTRRQDTAPIRTRTVGMRISIGMLTNSIVDTHGVQWKGTLDAARERDADLVCFVGSELGRPEEFGGRANAIYDLVSDERLDGLVVWTAAVELFAGRGDGGVLPAV